MSHNVEYNTTSVARRPDGSSNATDIIVTREHISSVLTALAHSVEFVRTAYCGPSSASSLDSCVAPREHIGGVLIYDALTESNQAILAGCNNASITSAGTTGSPAAATRRSAEGRRQPPNSSSELPPEVSASFCSAGLLSNNDSLMGYDPFNQRAYLPNSLTEDSAASPLPLAPAQDKMMTPTAGDPPASSILARTATPPQRHRDAHDLYQMSDDEEGEVDVDATHRPTNEGHPLEEPPEDAEKLFESMDDCDAPSQAIISATTKDKSKRREVKQDLPTAQQTTAAPKKNSSEEPSSAELHSSTSLMSNASLSRMGLSGGLTMALARAQLSFPFVGISYPYCDKHKESLVKSLSIALKEVEKLPLTKTLKWDPSVRCEAVLFTVKLGTARKSGFLSGWGSLLSGGGTSSQVSVDAFEQWRFRLVIVERVPSRPPPSVRGGASARSTSPTPEGAQSTTLSRSAVSNASFKSSMVVQQGHQPPSAASLFVDPFPLLQNSTKQSSTGAAAMAFALGCDPNSLVCNDAKKLRDALSYINQQSFAAMDDASREFMLNALSRTDKLEFEVAVSSGNVSSTSVA